jgi:hypothetical protein
LKKKRTLVAYGFGLLFVKARARHKKNKGEDERANNVIVDGAALMRPHQNAFGYFTNA